VNAPGGAFLLDINVVLAVLDPAHDHHEMALLWFNDKGRRSFATCPVVEIGVLRIASSNAYPNRAGDVDAVRKILERLCDQDGHTFWPDSISLRHVLPEISGIGSKEVTDIYLLALAKANRGTFVTFDRRIRADRVSGADHLLFLLPA
jgi:uncharacterized protein